ncbi:MAG TPA: hypothetical protein VGK56_03225 [Anaerolineales bacterium]
MLDVSSEKLSRAVFHTLAYADVFEYPLTASEVYRYLTSTRASFEEVIQALGNESVFRRVGDYFTLHGREGIAETRKRRAIVAARLWPKGLRYGRIIAQLPFVRMVAITGSLAMSNAEAGNDIDYMIITVPNRLWTCRALALFVARLAKIEGISLCPNYLVTTDALQLNERSLYVAHELAQMIPLSGLEIYDELRRLNDWTDEYLPNAHGAPDWPDGARPLMRRSLFQSISELIFRLPFGDWLETWEMNRKIKRLAREQSSSLESCFTAHVCKGHIDRHGENIGAALAVRLQKTV